MTVEEFVLPSERREPIKKEVTETVVRPRLLIDSYNFNTQTVTYSIPLQQKEELNTLYEDSENNIQTTYLLFLIEEQTKNFIKSKQETNYLTIIIDEITYTPPENEENYIYSVHYTDYEC